MGPKGSSWIRSISFSRSSSSTARKVAITSLWFFRSWSSWRKSIFSFLLPSVSRMASIRSWTGNSCRGITVSSSSCRGMSPARARSRAARPYRFTFWSTFPWGSGDRAVWRLARWRHSRRAWASFLVFRYSTSMSTSICRGSGSSSPSSSGSRGSSIRDLIWSRMAAISKNSLATSRLYSCMALM